MKAASDQFCVTQDQRAVLVRLATGVLADPRRAERLSDSVIREIRASQRPMPLSFGALAIAVMEAARREADLVRIFREHRAQLVTLADRMVRDADCAADLVHEVFARFLGAPAKISKVESLRRWVVTSVKNRCRDWIRVRRRTPIIERLEDCRTTEEEERSVWAEGGSWIEERVRKLDAPPSERMAALIALRHIAENAGAIVEAIEADEISSSSGIERFTACATVDSPWSPATFRRYLRSVRRRLRQERPTEILRESPGEALAGDMLTDSSSPGFATKG